MDARATALEARIATTAVLMALECPRAGGWTAAPARAQDLARLAPAYVHVGGLDGFLHEDVDYAARLLAAGVPTELHVLPLVPHAFDQVAPDAAVTATANALSDAALARVLSV
jgi:acetyl esterase/lipase